MTMTGKLVHEETATDWDERFGMGGWRYAGGNVQTLQFMRSILHGIPQEIHDEMAAWNEFGWTGDLLEIHPGVIWDWGCAEGEGTALLRGLFPFCQVIGWDWSHDGITRAKARWPTCDFKVGDIREPVGRAHLTIASHVLEHMDDPAAVARNLLLHTDILVVAVPDFMVADDTMGGHEGAVQAEEWVPLVPGLIHESRFRTGRTNPEDGGYIVESSRLYLFKGAR